VNTAKGQALRKNLAVAHEAFLKADANYQRALAIAVDTEQDSDTLVALGREGRDYAYALTRYTNATMEWLMYIDTQLRTRKSKAKGFGE
jgi:hypothetical protein